MNTILIAIFIIISILACALLYCLGALHGYKEFHKLENDYCKKMVDIFSDFCIDVATDVKEKR